MFKKISLFVVVLGLALVGCAQLPPDSLAETGSPTNAKAGERIAVFTNFGDDISFTHGEMSWRGLIQNVKTFSLPQWQINNYIYTQSSSFLTERGYQVAAISLPSIKPESVSLTAYSTQGYDISQEELNTLIYTAKQQGFNKLLVIDSAVASNMYSRRIGGEVYRDKPTTYHEYGFADDIYGTVIASSSVWSKLYDIKTAQLVSDEDSINKWVGKTEDDKTSTNTIKLDRLALSDYAPQELSQLEAMLKESIRRDLLSTFSAVGL